MQNNHVRQTTSLPIIASWKNFHKVKFLSCVFYFTDEIDQHNFSWGGIRHLIVGCFFPLLCCEKIVKKLDQQLHLSWEFSTEAGVYWFLKSFFWGTGRGAFIFGTVSANLCFGSFQASVKIITCICPHHVSNYYFSLFFSIGCFRLVVFWISAKQLYFFKNSSAKSNKQDFFSWNSKNTDSIELF